MVTYRQPFFSNGCCLLSANFFQVLQQVYYFTLTFTVPAYLSEMSTLCCVTVCSTLIWCCML